MDIFISALVLISAVSGVQINYGNPIATSYIYRSDNDGPASLIQLGGHGYVQPQAFAPPLPLVQPLKALEAYDLAPAPLPYVGAKPIVIEDAEEDSEDEESDEYLDGGLGHGHEGGGGSDYSEENHAAHGEKGSKGYHTANHHAKGEAGSYGKEHKEGYFDEAKGGKGAHHDQASVYGKHHEGGENHKGGNNGHKSHFSKGENVTGYHKVFHKDEFKKDHDFYDVADKSGHFNKHGHENEHHGSEKGGHTKGGNIDAAFDKGGFGKSGFHAKGHSDEADVGHSAEEGNESHYNHQEDYGKKGGSGHEEEYEYDDDDDEDEDENVHH